MPTVTFTGFTSEDAAERFRERALTEAHHLGLYPKAAVESGDLVRCDRCGRLKDLRKLKYAGNGAYVCNTKAPCRRAR